MLLADFAITRDCFCDSFGRNPRVDPQQRAKIILLGFLEISGLNLNPKTQM